MRLRTHMASDPRDGPQPYGWPHQVIERSPLLHGGRHAHGIHGEGRASSTATGLIQASSRRYDGGSEMARRCETDLVNVKATLVTKDHFPEARELAPATFAWNGGPPAGIWSV